MNNNNNILTYKKYLQLDTLLNCQHLKSAEDGTPTHHESFFIIMHQTYELWFKQFLIETDYLTQIISAMDTQLDQIAEVLNGLERLISIQKLLNQQVVVLETLKPVDFLKFRSLLIPASGNQSYQYRLIEIKLGLYRARQIANEDFFSNFEKQQQNLFLDAAAAPSLFSSIEQWLSYYYQEAQHYLISYKAAAISKLTQQQHDIAHSLQNQTNDVIAEQLTAIEKSFNYVFDAANYQEEINKGIRTLKYESFISALFLYLNQNTSSFRNAYSILKYIIELDELMALWRYHHALMVQRMIGIKIGTGGTSGYNYLRNTVERSRIFIEFTNLSSYLVADI